MARILGYLPATGADLDGGPNETQTANSGVNNSGMYFKLNDFGAAGLRSAGWHNLKVVLTTDDGLSTDYEFYVDNVLAERVSNIGTAATLRSYDNIRIGSGVSSTQAAYYDNMSVEFIPAAMNPVVGLQGSGGANAPFLNLHLNSTGRDNVNVNFNLRDIDGSPDHATQRVALQYRIGGSGAYINVPAAFVSDASTGPNQATQVTAVSASLPEWSNVADLQIRIITTDAAGVDEWIGVDDIVVSSTVVTTAHVDDDWTGLLPGTVVDADGDGLNGIQHAEIGFDAFATIQDGIDAVQAGGNVVANAGNYTADVVINKAVTLRSTSGAAATVIQGVSTGSGGAVRVTADGVTIGDAGQGFTINGAGESALYVVQSVDNLTVEGNAIVAANGKNAILTEGGVSDLTFEGNTFDAAGIASQLVYVNGQASVGIPSTNVNFLNNILDGDASGPLLGLESTGGQVTGNQFNGATPYTQLELWGAGNTVSGNTFSGSGGGSFLVDPLDAYDISEIVANNTFAGGTVMIERGGVLLGDTFTTIVGALDTAQSDDVIYVGAGTYVEALDITIDVTIIGVGGGGVTLDGGPLTTPLSVSGATTVVSISGLTIAGGIFAVDVDDATLNLSDVIVTGGSAVGVFIDNGGAAIIEGSLLDGAGSGVGVAIVSGSATIIGSVLTDRTDGVVISAGGTATLTNNDLSDTFGNKAIQANPAAGIIDASGNWWGTTSEAAVAAKVLGTIDFSPYLASGADGDAGFGFDGDFSHLYVTALGSQAGAVGRISEAINLIEDGALTGGSRLIDVNAGAYAGQVIVDESVTLRGAQVGVDARTPRAGAESIIEANGASDALIEVTASNVTIDGFTVDGADLAFRDVRVNGVDFAKVLNNIITDAPSAACSATVPPPATPAGWSPITSSRVSHRRPGNLRRVGLRRQLRLGDRQRDHGRRRRLRAVLLSAQRRRRGQRHQRQRKSPRPARLRHERARDAVAATTALSGNTHNITGAGGVGVQLYNVYKTDGVTLTNETITGADVGVYAFVNGGSVSITGGSIDGSDAPGSIGVQVTNYLADFGYAPPAMARSRSTASTSATSAPACTSRTTRWARSPFTRRSPTTPILPAHGTAILVSGADASADITNNDNSIHGNTVGIDVDRRLGDDHQQRHLRQPQLRREDQ